MSLAICSPTDVKDKTDLLRSQRNFPIESELKHPKSAPHRVFLLFIRGYPFVVKTSAVTMNDGERATLNNELIKEFAIGYTLNKLRTGKGIYNFMNVYSLWEGNQWISGTKEVNVIVDTSIRRSMRNNSRVIYSIFEKIDGITLHNHLQYKSDYRRDLGYILQFLLATLTAGIDLGFTHYDPHQGNIILRPPDGVPSSGPKEKFCIKYDQIQDIPRVYIVTDAITTIIDYGLARINTSEGVFGNDKDKQYQYLGINDTVNIIRDLYKFLMGILNGLFNVREKSSHIVYQQASSETRKLADLCIRLVQVADPILSRYDILGLVDFIELKRTGESLDEAKIKKGKIMKEIDEIKNQLINIGMVGGELRTVNRERLILETRLVESNNLIESIENRIDDMKYYPLHNASQSYEERLKMSVDLVKMAIQAGRDVGICADAWDKKMPILCDLELGMSSQQQPVPVSAPTMPYSGNGGPSNLIPSTGIRLLSSSLSKSMICTISSEPIPVGSLPSVGTVPVSQMTASEVIEPGSSTSKEKEFYTDILILSKQKLTNKWFNDFYVYLTGLYPSTVTPHLLIRDNRNKLIDSITDNMKIDIILDPIVLKSFINDNDFDRSNKCIKYVRLLPTYHSTILVDLGRSMYIPIYMGTSGYMDVLKNNQYIRFILNKDNIPFANTVLPKPTIESIFKLCKVINNIKKFETDSLAMLIIDRCHQICIWLIDEGIDNESISCLITAIFELEMIRGNIDKSIKTHSIFSMKRGGSLNPIRALCIGGSLRQRTLILDWLSQYQDSRYIFRLSIVSGVYSISKKLLEEGVDLEDFSGVDHIDTSLYDVSELTEIMNLLDSRFDKSKLRTLHLKIVNSIIRDLRIELIPIIKLVSNVVAPSTQDQFVDEDRYNLFTYRLLQEVPILSSSIVPLTSFIYQIIDRKGIIKPSDDISIVHLSKKWSAGLYPANLFEFCVKKIMST
jgi:hypothetical protein